MRPWSAVWAAILGAALMVAGCTTTVKGVGGVNSTAGQSAVGQSIYIFPDLPVPVELEQDMDRTMLIKTPQFQGGIVVLRGRVTVKSLLKYFSQKLTENGWQLVGSMTAKRSLLAFSKGNEGHCLVQIYETSGGFNTEVQIWLVEPMRGVSPQPPPPAPGAVEPQPQSPPAPAGDDSSFPPAS